MSADPTDLEGYSGTPLALGVDLRLPGQPTRRGILWNLKPQGACLKRTGLPAWLRNNSRLEIGMRIPPEGQEGYFRVAAEFVRVDAQGAEVQFLDPPSAFMAALEGYLQVLSATRTRTEAEEQERTARWRRIDIISRGSVGAQAAALVRDLLEAVSAGLTEQGKQGGSDRERTQARDDAERLRQACSRGGMPLRLAGQLLKLTPRTNADKAPILLDDEHTTLWLATRSLTEQLEAELAIPLRQLADCLRELQAGDARPPCAPAALAQLLAQTLKDLDISLEGRLYALRGAAKCAQPLEILYQQLLAAWERSLF